MKFEVRRVRTDQHSYQRTSLLSSVSRTATPASTFPTVNETSILLMNIPPKTRSDYEQISTLVLTYCRCRRADFQVAIIAAPKVA
jgi:hypothetical protein